MRRALPALAAALLLSLAAGRARADDETWEGFSLGMRADYFWGAGSETIATGKTFGGVEVEYTSPFGLGLAVSSDFKRLQLPQQTEINVYPLHADLTYYPVSWRLSPYFVGGADWILADRFSGDEGDDRSRLGIEGGGGLEFRWSDGWSLFGEYRRLWLIDKNVAGSDAKDGQYLMSGLRYRF